MSRLCQCIRRCRHLVRGSAEPLLPPERLVDLFGVLDTLIDAAHAFDQDGLQLVPGCGIHGLRDIGNSECICLGQRYTAAEFLATLQLDMRSAAQRQRFEPSGRPNRKRDGEVRMSMAAG